MIITNRHTSHVTASLTLLSVGLLMLVGCSSDEKTAPSPARSATSTPTPPPSYSPGQVKEALLSADEVGKGVRETATAVEALKNKQVPMCSLTSASLKGEPEITISQYANTAKGADEVRYAQLVARYRDHTSASDSFQGLQKKASACPAKRHVPPKKIRANFTLFAHDDTWKVTRSSIGGWNQLRGTEQQTYPASASKYNVLHYYYDYAVRGNVVIASVYWERSEPKKSADPIARRATELLTKQLQKFG